MPYENTQDEIVRLNNIIKSQKNALNHWRKEADLDYMRQQRMYLALVATRDHVRSQIVLDKIDAAISEARFFLPE